LSRHPSSSSFFTTKEEGLGMGLAISRAIVEAHGGRLLVENDPGDVGAIFRLHLCTNQPATTSSRPRV
jgi:signal transduction histidine kinase